MKPISLGKIRPVIVHSFVVTCCGAKWYGGWEGEVLAQLMQHVRTAHPELMPEIEKHGRAMARSQNGRGYFDGSDKDTGWGFAPPQFRESWMMEALLEAVKNAR